MILQFIKISGKILNKMILRILKIALFLTFLLPAILFTREEPAREISVNLGKGVKLQMVLIPPGEFLMGSPSKEKGRDSDETIHKVRITRPFYIGKYEVTQKQWKAIMGNNPSHFRRANNPVEKVSWNNCREFIERLNRMIPGGGFRLPTEAEWEYACRAGTTDRFYWGDDPSYTEIEKYAWYKKNSAGKTHPVGTKEPNRWGLYDMSGNVWEYYSDWYQKDYPTSLQVDPKGLNSGEQRGFRSGSYKSRAWYCRSANRGGLNPDFRSNNFGFRCARTLPF